MNIDMNKHIHVNVRFHGIPEEDLIDQNVAKQQQIKKPCVSRKQCVDSTFCQYVLFIQYVLFLLSDIDKTTSSISTHI